MSKWETQELPVLRALAVHFAKPGAQPPSVADIAAETGFTEGEVVETLRVLSEAKPPYVEGVSVRQGHDQPHVTALTERAFLEMQRMDLREGLARNPTGRKAPKAPRGARPPGAPH